MPSSTPLLLAPASGSSRQFVFATLPLAVVLIYFLFAAARRPYLPLYQLGDDDGITDDEYQRAVDETGPTIRITDMVYSYLAVYCVWCLFGVYLFVFIPKRRHFIGRYLRDGKSTVGNVLVNDDAGRCCGRMQDYGYVVYAHPENQSSGQMTMIRKKVRVFQNYTRETVGILLLPDRPKSGQPRVDLELDLQAASADRDVHHPALARTCVVWLLFTAVAPSYLIYVLTKLHDEDDNADWAIKCYLVTLFGIGPIGSYVINLFRWIWYVRWMTVRGAVIDTSAGNDGGGLLTVPSMDGTELPTMKDYHGDSISYQGSLREAKRAGRDAADK